jgi:hypothetical protein
VKDEEDSCHDKREASRVVPLELFSEIQNRKDGKNGQRNDFLDGFELRGVEFVGADAIRGDLEAVLEERNAPTDQHNLPQRRRPVFQVAVPSKSHENVGDS